MVSKSTKSISKVSPHISAMLSVHPPRWTMSTSAPPFAWPHRRIASLRCAVHRGTCPQKLGLVFRVSSKTQVFWSLLVESYQMSWEFQEFQPFDIVAFTMITMLMCLLKVSRIYGEWVRFNKIYEWVLYVEHGKHVFLDVSRLVSQNIVTRVLFAISHACACGCLG